MITEIIKGVIAIVVIIGAIAAVMMKLVEAQQFLIPLAGFAFGYYFKQAEAPTVKRIKAAFGRS